MQELPDMNTIYVRTSGAAIASMVFGILAWVALPLLGAILAVVLGHIARAEIHRAPPGGSAATAWPWPDWCWATCIWHWSRWCWC
ncbi:hypothetical protein B1B_04133 [mine drainage metagenome]|uniref:DUF4190 domain-containing protein n=1 Tax=mine drainage metagenome TaxID=410659 RepID=T1BG93_9ZZZZ